jgi:hypothetical protein
LQYFIASFIFFLAASYTLIRYIALGDTEPQNIPVFLLNKTLAFSSILYFLCLFVTKSFYNKPEWIDFWGKAVFHSAVLHSIISITALSPLYYPHLYDWQKMNWYGELSTLFGILGLYLLFMQLRLQNLKKLSWTLFNLILAILFSSHILCIGYESWIHPERWHGNLYPISLISFMIATLALGWSCVLLLKAKTNPIQ